MSHLAAVIPAARAPIEVQELETPLPGHHEVLVKNELIALNPIEAKIAKHAIFPTQYPAILGSSFGGTIIAVGSGITSFQIGDKVVVYQTSRPDNGYGALQRYVLAGDVTTSNVPENVKLSHMVTMIGNLTTVVGLFSGTLGVDKPDVTRPKPSIQKKVLIYGGTSSVGSLSIQYVIQAGYTVVTTTSPKHADFVSKLGAVQAIDHTQGHEAIVKSLVAYGPYDIVVDTIALADTIKVTAKVLAAQGGGKLYALLPAPNLENLPQGVIYEFAAWPSSLAEEKNAGLLSWAFQTYLPTGLASGKLLSHPAQKVSGGLEGVSRGFDLLDKGVSGMKLLIDPWE